MNPFVPTCTKHKDKKENLDCEALKYYAQSSCYCHVIPACIYLISVLFDKAHKDINKCNLSSTKFINFFDIRENNKLLLIS